MWMSPARAPHLRFPGPCVIFIIWFIELADWLSPSTTDLHCSLTVSMYYSRAPVSLSIGLPLYCFLLLLLFL